MSGHRGPALLLAVLALAALAMPAFAARPATLSLEYVQVHADGDHVLMISVLDASGDAVPGLENAFGVTLDGGAVTGLRAEPARAFRPRATVTILADDALLAGSSRAEFESALESLAGQLVAGDRVRLVAVGQKARSAEAEAAAAKGLVGKLATAGATESPHLYDALVDAMRASSRLPADRGGVVLVVTRGADGGSRRGPIDVLALARSHARLTPVMVVLLGDRGATPEAERLRRLAASTGGAFAEVTSAYGLGPVLGGLARRGLDLWRVSFTAQDWKRDVPRHRLGLSVEHEGTRRTATAEYATADALAPSWWSQPLPWLVAGLLIVAGALAWVLTRRGQKGLLVHDGDAWDGMWYEVFAFPVSIGAATGNDLVLGDSQVSRNHAVLERRGGGVELSDLNSENGTFVNGERVTRRVLVDGDRLSFGPATHLIYEARG